MNRIHSLKKNAEIKRVLDAQQKKISGAVSVYVKSQAKPDLFKMAISVPKKFGNAVKRNKMKRWIREIIRELQLGPGFDYFVLVKVSANQYTFLELKKHIDLCFQQHGHLKGEQQ
jgi:ribonuclease P protein component